MTLIRVNPNIIRVIRRQRYFADLVCGLEYLHHNNIVHRCVCVCVCARCVRACVRVECPITTTLRVCMCVRARVVRVRFVCCVCALGRIHAVRERGREGRRGQMGERERERERELGL